MENLPHSKKIKIMIQTENHNSSEGLGGLEPVKTNLKMVFVHEIEVSEEEIPRPPVSPLLIGCKNPEVRWEQSAHFSHILR